MVDLDGIEARAKAAFRAPWTATPFTVECDGRFGDHAHDEYDCELDGERECVRIESPDEYPGGQIVCDVPGLQEFSDANAAFIAHAREDVPALVAELRTSRAQVEALTKALEKIADPIGFFDAEARANGDRLNGAMAVRLRDDASWGRGAAKDALAALTPSAKGKP